MTMTSHSQQDPGRLTVNEPVLTVEHRDRVAWLRLNRPRAANALNESLHQALISALSDAQARPSVTAVVLCASGGRVFSAGADLKEFAELDGLVARRRRRALLRDTLLAFCDFDKPVVACVEGKAIGAGAMLALIADHCLLESQATLSMPEIGLGSASPMAVSVVMGRAGRDVAIRMVQAGEVIDARTAVDLRLADQVVEAPGLEPEADRMAVRLGSVSLRAYRQNRRWIYRNLRSEIIEAAGEFSNWIDQDNQGA
jgi:enoyl-CoA hydratase/carnithine racemase